MRIRTVGAVVAGLLVLFAIGFVRFSAGSTRGPSAQIIDGGRAIRVSYRGGARDQIYRDQAGRLFAFATVAARLPGDQQTKERLVVVTCAGKGLPGSVEIHDCRDFGTVWEYPFELTELPYNPREVNPTVVYNGKTGIVRDLDGDGDNEVVACYSAHPFSLSVLLLFDDDKQPVGSVIHGGHLECLQAVDCDKDRRADIVASGIHNASDGASLLFLRMTDFRRSQPGINGPSAGLSLPDSSRWDLGHQPCLAHLVIPRPPHLREELGVLELILPQNPFDVVPLPGGDLFFRLTVSIVPKDTYENTYFINFQLPNTLLGMIPNAPLVQSSMQWIVQGRTRVDFASDELMAEWGRTFRVYDYVRLRPPAAPPDDGLAVAEPSSSEELVRAESRRE